MVGRTISHYKILAKIGEGGMGQVYKADDLRLQRRVALKFLPLGAGLAGEDKTRFEREARAAAALDHPNICTVYEIDEAEGRPFISMAYLEGQTIQQLVQGGPLKVGEALDYAIQTAKGLAAAHEKGIVHRDVKSANLIVIQPGAGSEPQVKIMDFGLAQLAVGGSKLTQEGTTLGTAAYMSPEQTRGENVDLRTDIWSLGVVLYEMISGQLPFQGDYQQAVIYSILHEEPEPLTALRTGVGMELERIVLKSLAKDPSERYQAAVEFLTDLRTLQKQRESGVSRVGSPAHATGIGGVPAAPQESAPSATVPASGTPSSMSAAQADVSTVSPPKSPVRKYAALAAAAVALALSVAFLFRAAGPRLQGPPGPLQLKPLTSYPGTELFPTFSPDGNQIAFAWDGEKQDNLDIYVRLVEGGAPVRLTTDPAPDQSPLWAPDNRHIAFLRFQQRQAAVYVVPPFGGPERRIAEVRTGRRSSRVHHMAWSPDGKALAIVDRGSREEPGGIFLVALESGERTPMLVSDVPGPGGHSPVFSPDGQRLVFVRPNSPTSGDIFVMAAEADGPQVDAAQLTFDEATIYGLAWTPDGREILFSSDRGGGPSLWLIPSGGGEPRPLPFGGDLRQPAIAPAGRRLAFAQVTHDVNIWRADVPGGAGRQSEPVKLIASTRQEGGARYSPDGRRIAFHSNRSGNNEIWVCEQDGSNPVQLTYLGGPRASSPAWSPDGRLIAFQVTSGAKTGIQVIAADGGAPREIATIEGPSQFPSWSHDGQWIYFNQGLRGVWKVRAEPASSAPAEPVRLVDRGGFAQESLDGQFLYFIQGVPRRRRWQLAKMPVGGGDITALQEIVQPASPTAWMPAAAGLYFLDEEGAVRLFDEARGDAKLLILLATQDRRGPLGNWTISPDGRSVLYTSEDRSEADLMLVENFEVLPPGPGPRNSW